MDRSKNKFDGFREDDEIIINPEFGKSLKASLKASKRRLMLFIDNNDAVNPVTERSKFSSKKTPITIKSTSICLKYS